MVEALTEHVDLNDDVELAVLEVGGDEGAAGDLPQVQHRRLPGGLAADVHVDQ